MVSPHTYACYFRLIGIMAKTTTRPCFSNGTEWEWWMALNCGHCKKNASDSTLTFHCAIQRDIFKQAIGYGNEEIRLASYEATQQSRCPRIVENGTPPKHRKERKEPKGQLTIFD